jgi:hypothetical protein
MAPLLLKTSGGIKLAGGYVEIIDNDGNGNTKNQEVMSVKVSLKTRQKAIQLHKFQKLSLANRAWGKDEKLLRCNLLLVPTSINYTVLLAMGKGRRGGA